MVMFISTQVLAQSKDCLEMGTLSDSSEKVNHCGINSQQIAVKIEETSVLYTLYYIMIRSPTSLKCPSKK